MLSVRTKATNYGALGHMPPPPSTSNNFIFSSLWSKPESQLFKYCAVCEISCCRCQQLTALLISTAVVTKVLVTEQLLHPALKSTVSALWHNFHLCPSSQQILETPLTTGTVTFTMRDSNNVYDTVTHTPAAAAEKIDHWREVRPTVQRHSGIALLPRG